MNDANTLQKIQGLTTLVADAIEHGTRAIERVHLETARRPFAIVQLFPVVAVPARAVETVHDAVVTSSYATVRAVTRAVADAITTATNESR